MPLWKLVNEFEKKGEPKFPDIYVKFTSVSLEILLSRLVASVKKQSQKLLVYYNRIMRFWKLIHMRWDGLLIIRLKCTKVSIEIVLFSTVLLCKIRTSLVWHYSIMLFWKLIYMSSKKKLKFHEIYVKCTRVSIEIFFSLLCHSVKIGVIALLRRYPSDWLIY